MNRPITDQSAATFRSCRSTIRWLRPRGRYVRLKISAKDVIHAWAMPQFMLKVDAVPGRLNPLWFKVDEPGVYYGQCSELCGKDHSNMPIELRILPQASTTSGSFRRRRRLMRRRAYLDSVQARRTRRKSPRRSRIREPLDVERYEDRRPRSRPWPRA